MGITDPIKNAFQTVVRDAEKASEDTRVMNAFRNGTAVGMCVGSALATVGWVTFFWLVSLVR